MTAPVKYDVIDKLMVTLLSADDTNAIVAARSAVKRKLDASKLDIHKLFLRPPQTGSETEYDLLLKAGTARGEVESLKHTLEQRDAEIERLRTHADDPDITSIIEAAIKVDRRKAFAEYAALETEIGQLEQRIKGADAWTQTLTERAEAAEAEAEELLARAEVAEAIVAKVKASVG